MQQNEQHQQVFLCKTENWKNAHLKKMKNANLNTVRFLDGEPLPVLLRRDDLDLVLVLDLDLVPARVRAQTQAPLLPLDVPQVLRGVHRIGAFLLDHFNKSRN